LNKKAHILTKKKVSLRVVRTQLRTDKVQVNFNKELTYLEMQHLTGVTCIIRSWLRRRTKELKNREKTKQTKIHIINTF